MQSKEMLPATKTTARRCLVKPEDRLLVGIRDHERIFSNIWGQIGGKMSDCLHVFGIFLMNLTIGILWFMIGLKRRIKAWGWFPISHLDFFTKFVALGLLFIARIFSKYRKDQIVLKNSIFVNPRISNREHSGNACTRSLSRIIFEILKV